MRVLVLDRGVQRRKLHNSFLAVGVDPIGATTCAAAASIVDAGIDAACINLELDGLERFAAFATVEYIRARDLTMPIVVHTRENNILVRAMCRRLDVRETTTPNLVVPEIVVYFAKGQNPSGVRDRATFGEELTGTRARELAAGLLDAPIIGAPIDVARDRLYDEAIARAQGNLTKAGRLLGVSRQAVQQHVARKRRG